MKDAAGNNKSLEIYGPGNSFRTINREEVRQRWARQGAAAWDPLGTHSGLGICPELRVKKDFAY